MIKRAKKLVRKKVVLKKPVLKQKKETEKLIGGVKHYFTKIKVAVIKLKDSLTVGDNIHILGATTDFKQSVESMQIEHRNLLKAKAKQAIGMKIKKRVREGDKVYRVIK